MGIGDMLQWGNQNQQNAVQQGQTYGKQMTSGGLYDNWDQIKTLLQPLFDQQRGNLQRQQTSAMGDASRFGGAYAAAHGYDNPYSFQENSRNKVTSAFAPQFGNLETGQLQSLLGSTAQNNQFKNQNFWNLQNNNMQQQQLDFQKNQADFNFFRDFLPFALQAGTSIFTGGASRLGGRTQQ